MNKKVLLIAPTFFGYYKEMIIELEKKGYSVNYVSDIPSNSNIYKAITRINRNFGKIFVENYFKKKIEPLIKKNKYDYVFCVIGMTFSFFPNQIEKMKKYQENAKFLMYQWDGEKNIKFITKMHKYFDEVYTFDRIDAIENSVYKFLPLFYIDKYKNVKVLENYEYDVSYIGTAHPKKIKYVIEMSKKLMSVYPKQFIYNYMPSKLKYYYHKLTSKEYRNIKLTDLKFEKIASDKTQKIFEESKCILDSPQAGQIGLTIRTIECLGAKRKLITSNEDIKNYDFYKPENIYIYDGNFDYENIFFKSEYKEIDKDIYEKYSLCNWLKTIFNN